MIGHAFKFGFVGSDSEGELAGGRAQSLGFAGCDGEDGEHYGGIGKFVESHGNVVGVGVDGFLVTIIVGVSHLAFEPVGLVAAGHVHLDGAFF